MRKINFLYSLFILVLVSGCIRYSAINFEKSTSKENKCLSPLYNSYIPYVQEGEPVTPIPTIIPDETLAPFGWNRIQQLPDELGDNIELLFVSDLTLEKEFFFINHEPEKTILYVIDSKNFESYTFPKVTQVVKKDGVIYAVMADPVSQKISVHRFDEYFREFYSIVQNTNINATYLYDVEIDSESNLYLIIHESDSNFLYQLVSFNLITNAHNTIFLPDGWIDEIELDSSDNLYFVGYSDGDNKIYRYNDGQFEWQATYNTQIPGEIDDLTHLFISEDDQLWLSDALWFPKAGYTPDKRIIIRSPIFINPDADIRYPIIWESPEPQAITEDGRVWFKSKRGLAWHQPETGEWCMFTTAESNIVKDGDGNLWLVYDNALYMFPASETQAKDD
ncbi:MAG: hypothetical protein ACOX7O_06255 [Oscillospiraceae bacterium]|jgi:hypothetical protein